MDLIYSEECEDAAEAASKTMLFTRSCRDLATETWHSITLKVVIGVAPPKQILIEARFVRTLTSDRPDAAKKLSEEQQYDELVGNTLDKWNEFVEAKSEEVQTQNMSFKLIIGGKPSIGKLTKIS